MSKPTNHIIKFEDNELNVFGLYKSIDRETASTKGSDASFEISTIIYKGVDVYDLLNSIGNTVEQIENQILNEIYQHEYSL